MTSIVSRTPAQDKMVALASLAPTPKLFLWRRSKGPSILGASGGPLGVLGAQYFYCIFLDIFRTIVKENWGPWSPCNRILGPLFKIIFSVRMRPWRRRKWSTVNLPYLLIYRHQNCHLKNRVKQQYPRSLYIHLNMFRIIMFYLHQNVGDRTI